MDVLAERLHRLRAACCHPQVGSSGITAGKKLRRQPKKTNGDVLTTSGGSRIMTMEQILYQFIEDARQKCEENQRLFIMHTNAMAAISRLKVEAKDREISIPESNFSLLCKSCQLYEESLKLSQDNATPTLVLGEATITGNTGFCSPGMDVNEGSCTLSWNLCRAEAWAKFDFNGAARKITQIRIQTLSSVPADIGDTASENFKWDIVHPKECVFQVSSAALGGEFVNVASFCLPRPTDDSTDSWFVEGNFQSNKSKSWRLLVTSFHGTHFEAPTSEMVNEGHYMGVKIELYEADIASDPLQRLHCLHNAGVSFESLLELQQNTKDDIANELDRIPSVMKDPDAIKDRLRSVRKEAGTIESLYLEAARSIRNECKRRLDEVSAQRRAKEDDLAHLHGSKEILPDEDCWEDGWWDDFIVLAKLQGSDEQQRRIFERLAQELQTVVQGRLESVDHTGAVKFPEFSDIIGFRTALRKRVGDIRQGLGKPPSQKSRTATRASEAFAVTDSLGQPKDTRFRRPPGMHAGCMRRISGLSPEPSEAAVYENSHCKVCKADWGQTGPKCSHCKLGEDLEELRPDRVTIKVLKAVLSVVKSPIGTSLLKSSGQATKIGERAQIFFEILEAEEREIVAAWRAWRAQLDLLNDLDELKQCKSSMRLTFDGEDLSQITADQWNAVVIPIDINTRYHDHAAKQAMSIGDLRRSKDTLRYLKNQCSTNTQRGSGEEETCTVCLCPFDSERSVLRCGHSFHMDCLDKLKARSSSQWITCPMRCRVRTMVTEVMTASNKRKDDGSRCTRQIKGSWGTKVTRLVSDVLDVRDKAEKGIIFSQWEDMLDIVQEALSDNGINFVRVTSLRRIGDYLATFRTPPCTVLLLNVKNGAEGLTLLEATHVFMVEPLLNCGLDSQAINRIHRIGQNRKTTVWRYLMEGTIEVKIDKLRMDRQEDQLEDALNESRKSTLIKAGGIDGGFESQEQLMDLLS